MSIEQSPIVIEEVSDTAELAKARVQDERFTHIIPKAVPNAQAHREPPRRDLSVYPEPQHGGDAVARIVGP